MNRKGVTPVVAAVLLVVISVILSVILYVMVSGISASDTQQIAAVTVTDTPDGLSWKITFVTVPPALPIESVSLVLTGADGRIVLNATLLTDLSGPVYGPVRFSSITTQYTLAAGDSILLDMNEYPTGSFLLFTDNGILAQGVF